MNSLVMYVADCETTGLDSTRQEITEISIIRVSDRVQLNKNVKCDRPQNANLDSLRITNKTMSDLSKGDSKIDVIKSVQKFLNEDKLTSAHRCFICHNSLFDRKFLHAMWKEANYKFPADLWLDTIPMCKLFAKNNNIIKPKVNLSSACDLLGIKKVAGFHSAKGDTRNTYFLYKSLLENKIDYLPFIKNIPHIINDIVEEENLNDLY